MTRISTYRRFGRPSGATQVGLHGGLVTLTYLGHHSIVSEFYDACSATKQFRHRLNTRWVIPGLLTILGLVLLFPLLMAVKPEESGDILFTCLLGLMVCTGLVTILSLFFLRSTVILKFYDDKKTYRVEFDYVPGKTPLLDTIVDTAADFDTPTGPLRISNTISHIRDWLAAFTLRYVVVTTWLIYKLLQYAAYALIAVLVVIMVVFVNFSDSSTNTPETPPANEPPISPDTPAPTESVETTESDAPSPLFVLVFATPALGVLGYTIREIHRAKGPWSHRQARRQILRKARKNDMSGVKSQLESMLTTDPGDYESAFLLTQLQMGDGDYDSARAALSACTELTDAEWTTWNLHIDYIEMLDGRSTAPGTVHDRNWPLELAESGED